MRTPALLIPVVGVLRQWLVLALVLAGFSLHPQFLKTFWTPSYLPNLLQQAATNIILAVGMTFVVLTGGIDLSAGSVMALCGVTLGLTATTGAPPFLSALAALPAGAFVMVLLSRRRRQPERGSAAPALADTRVAAALAAAAAAGFALHAVWGSGAPLPAAIAATLLVGAGCGSLNGILVAYGGVPPFVVTLGMYTAARGLTVYATKGQSVSGLPPALGVLGQGWPLVAIALAVVAAAAVFEARTAPGRYLRAIGAGEEAARLTGVNVSLYKALAYMLSGLTAAIAAVVLTAKFRLADTGAGVGAELNAIAAVVIGGTSLSGGRGSVVGTLVGALTIAVLNAGLVLVSVPDTLQGVIIGAVIVLAVMADRVRGRG